MTLADDDAVSKRGGRRPGAGRKPIPGGRHEIPFVVLDVDRAAIEAAAGDQPVTEWLRAAAEQGLDHPTPKVRLPHGAPRSKLYASISGGLLPHLQRRASELGVARVATYLRLAALARLERERTG